MQRKIRKTRVRWPMKGKSKIFELVFLTHRCCEISVQKSDRNMQILSPRLLLDITRVGNDRFYAYDRRT